MAMDSPRFSTKVFQEPGPGLIEHTPTKEQLNSEAHEGEDAKEDGDEYPDDPICLFMIRHMDAEGKNWKDFCNSLTNSQKSPFTIAHGCCFFGFVSSVYGDNGHAGDPDFQKLIADFHGHRVE